ncbi:MAG: 7-cyano-7-deazaguanine synthase [Nanoarchaeota archaeon]|nr:7-cyano-7-deazaguanine synthase [Nanoarchaeota archaeon]
MKKALVLYSGGLDSRLAVLLLKEQGFKVETIHFTLPFGCGCCNLNCNFKFTQLKNIKMEIIDITKEPYLSEYLQLLKKPKHGTGAGINPCKDCKIFMFKKAKEYADKNKIQVIATGEVAGQRPMSQTSKAMKTIEEEIGFEIRRPLIEAGISGRSRKKQMELAKKFEITYPSPGGGCFLCEKEPKKRLKTLLKKDLINEKTLPLTMIGRHFFIDGIWFVVARDETESKLITKFETSTKDAKGKPSIYYNKKRGKQKALELQKAYSTNSSKKERDKFEKVKL